MTNVNRVMFFLWKLEPLFNHFKEQVQQQPFTSASFELPPNFPISKHFLLLSFVFFSASYISRTLFINSEVVLSQK